MLPQPAESESGSETARAIDPIQVRYDFRNLGEYTNQISVTEQAVAVAALQAWTDATNGQVEFLRDTDAPASQIVVLGKGDLAAFSYQSEQGGTLAIGGGTLTALDDGTTGVTGVAWLDGAETWDVQIGNGTDDAT